MENDIAGLTEKKMQELIKLSLLIEKQDADLMDVVRVHYKLWERKLFPYCKLVGISHVEVVAEILAESGIGGVARNKLITYLGRAKKELGGKNGK